MNDEAGSHYSSIVSQMFAGHEWIQQNLNVKPNTSYAPLQVLFTIEFTLCLAMPSIPLDTPQQ